MESGIWFEALLREDVDQIEKLTDTHIHTVYSGFPAGDAVMFCAFYNKPFALATLLNYLSKYNVPESQFGAADGMTALMLACMKDNIDCCKQLLFQKQRVTSKGITALMFASVYDAYECMCAVAPYETGLHTFEDALEMPAGTTALGFALHYKSRKCTEVLMGLEIIENYNPHVQ